MEEAGAELEPELSRSPLAPETVGQRILAADEYATLRTELQPNIDVHVEAYAHSVEILVNTHARIANETDLEIGSNTRWSALWELSGRCLSECRLLVHALRGGFALEASSNERAVFEALYLLSAVAFDDDVARSWLRGEYVRPKRARAVMAKRDALARRRMREAGITPAGDVASSGEWLYDQFSQSAHHRRGPITQSVAVSLREFAYGPHPDPRKQARETVNAGHTIETALIVVIDAFAHLVGRPGIEEVLAEQRERLDRVRDDYPLPN